MNHGVAGGPRVALPAGVRIEVGGPRTGFPGPIGVRWGGGEADGLQCVENLGADVLAAVVVAGSQRTAYLAVVRPTGQLG